MLSCNNPPTQQSQNQIYSHGGLDSNSVWLGYTWGSSCGSNRTVGPLGCKLAVAFFTWSLLYLVFTLVRCYCGF